MENVYVLQNELERIKTLLQKLCKNLCLERMDSGIGGEIYQAFVLSRGFVGEKCRANEIVEIRLDDESSGFTIADLEESPSFTIVDLKDGSIVNDHDEICFLLIKMLRKMVVQVSEEIAKEAILSGFRFLPEDFETSTEDRERMYREFSGRRTGFSRDGGRSSSRSR